MLLELAAKLNIKKIRLVCKPINKVIKNIITEVTNPVKHISIRSHTIIHTSLENCK